MTKAIDLAAPEKQGPEEQNLQEQAIEESTSKLLADDATRLGGYAYQIIRQQSKAVFKLRSQVIADTDIENLHQMRIGTRRLRAALLLFSDVLEPDQASDSKGITDLSKPVKQLTKALGKVRDIDVMQAWLGDQQAISGLRKKEKKTIESLLKKLKKRRKKQFSKMEDTLTSRDYKQLAKKCKKWLKQPSFGSAAQQPATTGAVRKIVEPLTALLQHPGWGIATRKQGKARVPTKSITLDQLNQQLETDGELLHDLRKQIKQTRYQTEFFRGLYGITYAAQIREFRKLQKVLGQVQDQLVISEFLTDEIGKDWTEKLPTIYQAFQDSRLALWQQWQPLQAKYLKLAATLPEQIAA